MTHLGNIIARTHKILINKQFDHPSALWKDEWCLAFADVAITNIHNLALILDHDTHKLKIVKHYLDYYQLLLKPKLNQLTKCIILGDVNDTNVICDDSTKYPNIIAIFDFGESHLTAKVFDLAISCAYFMIGKGIKDGLSSMIHITKGYNNILPLQSTEIDVLFIAIMSRMLVSAVLGVRNAKENPKNPYLLHHATPAWKTLDRYLHLITK